MTSGLEVSEFVVERNRVCCQPARPDAITSLACMIPAARGAPRNMLRGTLNRFVQSDSQRLFLKIGKPGSGKSSLEKGLSATPHIETTFTKALAIARGEIESDPAFAQLPIDQRERQMRLRASQRLADVALVVTSDDLIHTEGQPVRVKMTMEIPGFSTRDTDGVAVERGEMILRALSSAARKRPTIKERYSGVMLVSDRRITQRTIRQRRGKGTQLGGTSHVVAQIDRAVRKSAYALPTLDRELSHLRCFSGTVDRSTQVLAAYARHFLRTTRHVGRIPVFINRYTSS